LFCVSVNQLEPELYPETIEKLKNNGWLLGENVFGQCLICPEKERKRIVAALADSIINWRITSNQSRTFSLMDTVAVAISYNANQVAYAIRAQLDQERERQANPIIDETTAAKIFLTPSISAFIKGTSGSATSLDDASSYLNDQMLAFPYESQTMTA
jgi:hypothetical protein